ncbi:MAG: hypothetical protein NC320_03005 [Clostridium sp.]|nr:hypothetical protein [Clostridium sp.]
MSRGLQVDYSMSIPEVNENCKWKVSTLINYFIDKYALSAVEYDTESRDEILDKLIFLMTETCILTDEDEILAKRLVDYCAEH